MTYTDYLKTYSFREGYQKDAYLKNVVRIDEHNRINKMFKLGINQFTGLDIDGRNSNNRIAICPNDAQIYSTN